MNSLAVHLSSNKKLTTSKPKKKKTPPSISKKESKQSNERHEKNSGKRVVAAPRPIPRGPPKEIDPDADVMWWELSGQMHLSTYLPVKIQNRRLVNSKRFINERGHTPNCSSNYQTLINQQILRKGERKLTQDEKKKMLSEGAVSPTSRGTKDLNDLKCHPGDGAPLKWQKTLSLNSNELAAWGPGKKSNIVQEPPKISIEQLEKPISNPASRRMMFATHTAGKLTTDLTLNSSVSNSSRGAVLGNILIPKQKKQYDEEKELSDLMNGNQTYGKFGNIEVAHHCSPVEPKYPLNTLSAFNEMDNWNQLRFAKSKDEVYVTKKEAALEAKMRKAQKQYRKRLKVISGSKATYRKHLENLPLESDTDDEEEESLFTQASWDLQREMQEVRDNIEYYKIIKDKIRKKLVTRGFIAHEDDLSHVDSVIESAFNSEKALEWGKRQSEASYEKAPHASLCSESEFDIWDDDTSEESEHEGGSGSVKHGSESAPTVQIEKNNTKKDKEAIRVATTDAMMDYYGLSEDATKKDPKKVIFQVREAVEKLNKQGKKYSLETIKAIFKKLCGTLNIAPVDVFAYYQDDCLELKNYKLNEGTTKAISFVLPFLQDMKQLKFNDCGLNDSSASWIIEGTLGVAECRTIHLNGIEFGASFLESMEKHLAKDPQCLDEFSLSHFKAAQTLVRLVRSLIISQTLTYLDLQENSFNFLAATSIALLIYGTKVLSYLNLNSCNLRGVRADVVLDGLMTNTSIEYLDLGGNSFYSEDDVLCAKLGRILRGHPALIHVDCSRMQLKKADCLYLTNMVRDSENIQILHLTGNPVSYYDRLMMRAMLPAKVSTPTPPSVLPRFDKISAGDRVQLIMLNIFILDAIPPPDFRELGLAQIKDISDFKKKLASYSRCAKINSWRENDLQVEGRTSFQQKYAWPLLNEKLEEYTKMKKEQEEKDQVKVKEMIANQLHTQVESVDDKTSMNFQSELGKQADNIVAVKESKKRKQFDIFRLFELLLDSVPEVGSHANPMRGHRDKIIFSRVLGHPDLEQNEKWYDCADCWICDKRETKVISIANKDHLQDIEFEEIIQLSALIKKRYLLAESMKADIAHSKVLGAVKETLLEANDKDSDPDEAGSCESASSKDSNDVQEKNNSDDSSEYFEEDDGFCFINVDDNKVLVHNITNKKNSDKKEQDGIQKFNHFSRAQFQVQVRRNQLQNLTLDANESNNKTLFESNLSAEPFQLKDTLKSINPLLSPPTQADRIRFPNYSFSFQNGIYFRNFFKDEKRFDGYSQLKETIKVPESIMSGRVDYTIKKLKNSQTERVTDYLRCKSASANSAYGTKSRRQRIEEGGKRPVTQAQGARQRRPQIKQVLETTTGRATTAPTMGDVPSVPPLQLDGTQTEDREVDYGDMQLDLQETEREEELKFNSMFGPYVASTDIEKMSLWGVADLPESDDFCLVASWNSWIPVRMGDKIKMELASPTNMQVPPQLEASVNQRLSPDVTLSQPSQSLLQVFKQGQSQATSTRNQRSKRGSTLNIPTGDSRGRQSQDSSVLERTSVEESCRIPVEYKEHACMLRPGDHYFYFVKGGKYFVLSKKYPKGYFKETNIQMNFVTIQHRKDWRIPPRKPRVIEWGDNDESSDDEFAFNVRESVFKNFRWEDKYLLNRMLNNDWSLTKMEKIIKDPNEQMIIFKTVQKNYAFIKNMYLQMVCESSFPNFSFNDYSLWVQKLELLGSDKHVTQAAIDLCYTTSIFRSDKAKPIECAKSEIMRFEILELLVRMVQLIYKFKIFSGDASKPTPEGKMRLNECIEHFIETKLKPAVVIANQDEFRKKHLHNHRVSKFFERNLPIFKKMMSKYNHAGKECLTPQEAFEFVQKLGGMTYIPERTVSTMFGYAKASVPDLLKGWRNQDKLVLHEFLEFFGRLSHAAFELSEEFKEQPLNLKIDAVLSVYCEKIKFPKIYTQLPPHQQDILKELIEQQKKDQLTSKFSVAEKEGLIKEHLKASLKKTSLLQTMSQIGSVNLDENTTDNKLREMVNKSRSPAPSSPKSDPFQAGTLTSVTTAQRKMTGLQGFTSAIKQVVKNKP